MDEPMETPIHMLRAGEFLMYTLWLQSQMADLLILNEDRALVEERTKDSSVIPQQMVEARAEYMKKSLGKVLEEFRSKFKGVLSCEDIDNLEKIRLWRNMIAHSHVSLGRRYLLHVPDSQEKMKRIKETFRLESVPDQSDPPQVKLAFNNNDRFRRDFETIKHFEEKCFARVAKHVGIRHSLIR